MRRRQPSPRRPRRWKPSMKPWLQWARRSSRSMRVWFAVWRQRPVWLPRPSSSSRRLCRSRRQHPSAQVRERAPTGARARRLDRLPLSARPRGRQSRRRRPSRQDQNELRRVRRRRARRRRLMDPRTCSVLHIERTNKSKARRCRRRWMLGSRARHRAQGSPLRRPRSRT